MVDLDLEGGLKMLSIRVNSIESTRIIQIDWSLWPHFKNEEGSCIVISRILTSDRLCRVGWKSCRFESIRSTRHKSFPLLSIRHAVSRFARCDSVRIELRRNMQIESNRKVPQTNRLSLGVLDMDVDFSPPTIPNCIKHGYLQVYQFWLSSQNYVSFMNHTKPLPQKVIFTVIEGSFSYQLNKFKVLSQSSYKV